MKAKATGLTEPNQYRVDLRWAPALLEDSRADDRTWILLRGKNADEPTPLITLKKDQTSAQDLKIESGTSYTYVLGFFEEAQFIEKERTQITIPTDFVISGTIRLPQLTQYNRIFINPDGVILTEGTRFQITAEELHSQGGTLITSNDSELTNTASSAEAFEMAVIQVNKAVGTLHIKAVGKTGSKGRTGAQGAKGLTGPTGAKSELLRIRSASEDWVTTSWPPIYEPWQNYFKCQNPGGSDGGVGLPGYPGSQGGTGENGSNSPKIFVEALDAPDFTVSVDKIPGKGGEGGDGGPGGEGGDGGSPGSWDVHQICPKPAIGPRGIQGPQGPKGDPGQDGKISTVCLRVDKKEDGDCSLFFIKNGVVF